MGVAAIAGAIGAAMSVASFAYQMSQSPPGYPAGNAQAAGVLAQAEALPYQRGYQAAAEQGGTAVRAGYGVTNADYQRARLQAALDALGPPSTAPPGAGGFALLQASAASAQRRDLQAQLDALPPAGSGQRAYYDPSGRIVPAREALVNFRGFGTADVQGQLARQMDQVQLELQRRYGVPFAEEARAQLAQADPEGTAAREELYRLIEQQNQQPYTQPVADLLDAQVSEQLASGNKLDATQRALLDQAVGQAQQARGQDANADTQQFATPLETGFEGQQRALAAANKATAWLGSGSTPEDVAYRRAQQNLSNLGAFIAGQTPEAQFGNLSGAQQGTTPQYYGQPLPQAGGQAGQASQGYTTAGYLQNLRYQQSQTNPWMAGLSGALNLAAGLNRAGAFGSTGAPAGG